jgi:hypothetical protein
MEGYENGITTLWIGLKRFKGIMQGYNIFKDMSPNDSLPEWNLEAVGLR